MSGSNERNPGRGRDHTAGWFGRNAHSSLTHRELCSVIRMRKGSWAFSHSPSVVVARKRRRKPTGSSGSWWLRVAPLAWGFPQNKQSLNKQLEAKHTEASREAYSYDWKDPKGPGGSDSISYNIGVCHPLILSTCLWRWYYTLTIESLHESNVSCSSSCWPPPSPSIMEQVWPRWSYHHVLWI